MKINSSGLPPSLWALTICAYSIGTTEFVIVGLLPNIAQDLNTSIVETGFLVSLYALGVAIGAPVLTSLTTNFNRKNLLITVILFFVLGNILAAVSFNFYLLILARILTGFAHGVFFSIGSTIAANLVPVDKRASAISAMFAGLTVAIITGVPLGTLIGNFLGWRFAFVGVSFLGAIGALFIYILLPKTLNDAKPIPFKNQLKVLQNRSILLVLTITVFGYGGTFVTFTYFAPYLEKVIGFSADSVSLFLLIYGIAIALGNYIGGKVSNKRTGKALLIMFALQALILILYYLTSSNKMLSVISLFILGILAFSNVPALQLYIVKMSEKYLPGTEDISSALNIAAFNVGIALGAYTGGIIVSSSLGLVYTPIVGSIFVFIGFLLTVILYIKERS